MDYQFSERFVWNSDVNRLNKLLSSKKKEGILDLTISNPTKAKFNYSDFSLEKALSAKENYLYEPNPGGSFSLRRVITAHYRKSGINIDSEYIFPLASTSEAYSYLFKLLCNPGDEVLFPHPSYPLFNILTRLEGIIPVAFDMNLANKTWEIDFQTLENSLSCKTKAVIIVNPNNPTGTFLRKNSIDKLRDICSRHKITIIVDEVFLDYVSDKNMENIYSTANRSDFPCFVLSGLSKIAGLPQFKLGWIYVNGPEEFRYKAAQGLEIISDAFLSLSTPIQNASVVLLEKSYLLQEQIKKRIFNNYQSVCDKFACCREIEVMDYQGGWYLIIKQNIFSDEEFCYELLRKENVYLHPGYFYDFKEDNFLVISLLTACDILEDGLQRIINFTGSA